MAFKDTLLADLSIVFNTDEFGVTVTHSGGSFTALFVNFTDIELNTNNILLSCRSVDVSNLAINTSLTVNATTYKLLAKSQNKDGVTEIVLV